MNGIEKKLLAKNSYAIDLSEYDDNAKYLIGWPGYRTSNNKSGLGYLETRSELAHTQGMMIRWLLTGKFRTYNPLYLLGMMLIGICFGAIPVVFILHEVMVAGNLSALLLPIGLPNIVVGVLLLINTVLSLLHWKKGRSITGD
jgi:hypothetical protein